MRRSRKEAVTVYVEEDHNDVLPHICRSVGSKRIPVSGNVLVHFDSHPDLLLPSGLKSGDIDESPYILYDKVSIENWILPAVYMGIFRAVIWVKPPWSDQIPNGVYDFEVGKDPSSSEIFVTCLESYFLSEGIVRPREDLVERKEIRLIVSPLLEVQSFPVNSLPPLEGGAYVLDFDLDFFSVHNPFLNLFPRVNLYQRLKRIYSFDPVPSHLRGEDKVRFALDTSQRRKELLDHLAVIFQYLEENHGSLQGYSHTDSQLLQRVNSLVDDLNTEYEGEVINWSLIHDAGCTCDDTDLPNHESTDDEIRDLMLKVQEFLTRGVIHASLPEKPDVITIARSALDGFTPSEKVDEIQENLLNYLRALVPDFIVEKGYE